MADPNAEPDILRGHTDAVYAVAYSPDGKTLASASWDKTIRLWIVSPAELLALACTTAGRNLSVEEWQAAFGDRPYRRTCPQWPAGR